MTEEATNEVVESTSEPSYYLSEGVAGSGDAPEWFKGDKYKTVADQAKGYSELSKMHGELTNKYKSFSGAPEAYEINSPEGLDVQVDAEDPMLVRAQEWAKEQNMPQETFDGLVGMWAELQTAQSTALDEFQKEQISKIENYDSRNKNIANFLEANDMGDLAGVITSAEQMEQFEKLLEMTGKAQLDVTSEGSSVPTEEEINKLMFEKDEFGRQIYNYDKERQAKVRKMFELRVGKGMHQQMVG